jgi:prepilin-type N-terminal cleavage/methylation domain-containing protein
MKTPFFAPSEKASAENGSEGFSLIEMLISLAVLSLFLVAIYTILLGQTRSYTTQEVAAGAQQTVRMAIEFMASDLRLAGLDPLKSANPGFELATATAFRVTSDRVDIASGDTEANGQIDDELLERVTYRYDATDDTIDQVLYEGSPFQDTQELVTNVTGVTFRYFDQSGAETDVLSEIRSVGLLLTVEEPAGRDGMIERTYSTRIRCRNLGL